ncbi:ArsR/SmtB family transcription factor [Gymnodinialimonas sp.]
MKTKWYYDMHTDPHATFRALADPTRRDILGLLSAQHLSIGEVAEHFDMTRPAIKKHLRVLEEGHLITVTAKGRERINAINPDGFRAVESWLSFFDRFWDDRLSALKTAVEKETK